MLYYMSSAMYVGNQAYKVGIVRYSLASRTASTTWFDAGTASACTCAPFAAPGLPGWDVSPDGSRIIYQLGSPNNDTTKGGTKSALFQVASTDGTHFGTITLPTTDMLWPSWLRIALDGPHFALIAGMNAQGKQAILIEDCTDPTTAGSSACRAVYQAPAANYPGWTADSSAIYAGEQTLDCFFPGNSVIAQYLAQTPAGHAITTNGYSIWTMA
jgi:hypothetical protein